MIFQVGVVNHHQLRIHVRQRRANRRALAAVLFVAQPDPVKFSKSGWIPDPRLRKRSMASAVPSDEQSSTTITLTHPKRRFSKTARRPQARLDQILFVVGRHDYGKRCRHPLVSRAAGIRPRSIGHVSREASSLGAACGCRIHSNSPLIPVVVIFYPNTALGNIVSRRGAMSEIMAKPRCQPTRLRADR